ncbi:MAG: recombinase family protein [Chloroflexota bacterium]|nr:recombinase family protein [Chloroflexota bacterium]
MSSDDQRNRETVKTQIEMIKRFLKSNPHLVVFRWYIDDGVSGTVPMSMRPEGKLLLRDAAEHRFEAIIVLRADRLGRDEIDLLQIYALFVQLGLELIGVSEPIGDRFIFGIKAMVSADERRKFLARSAEGMARAAQEGRYTGGIVALGYRREGEQSKVRLVPDDEPFWRDWTGAELVRQIYGWLAQGSSCIWVANHLNGLGVPTHYVRNGHKVKERGGTRKVATQGEWRAGRIRNLIVNRMYRGEYCYGRRSKKQRDVIVAQVAALVPPEIWDMAQRTLSENRIITRRTSRTNILRSVVKCSIDGLTYTGAVGRDVLWLRCDGQIDHRGKFRGRCPGKSIKHEWLAPIVWRDLEGFLRDPGPIIDELVSNSDGTAASAAMEAERLGLEKALAGIPAQRDMILRQLRRGIIDEDECARQFAEIAAEEKLQRRRLDELAPVPLADVADGDLLEEIRQRLDDGVDDILKQEIVRILVRRIVVHTEIGEDGKKHATIAIEYRFPAVGLDCTGTGSSLPPA